MWSSDQYQQPFSEAESDTGSEMQSFADEKYTRELVPQNSCITSGSYGVPRYEAQKYTVSALSSPGIGSSSVSSAC